MHFGRRKRCFCWDGIGFEICTTIPAWGIEGRMYKYRCTIQLQVQFKSWQFESTTNRWWRYADEKDYGTYSYNITICMHDGPVHSKCLHFTTSLCTTPNTQINNSTHHKAHTQCHKFPTSTSIALGGITPKNKKERQTRILRRQTQKKKLNDKEREIKRMMINAPIS